MKKHRANAPMLRNRVWPILRNYRRASCRLLELRPQLAKGIDCGPTHGGLNWWVMRLTGHHENQPTATARWRLIAQTGLYLVLVLLGAWLLGWNLGARALWSDEAETALLAQGVQRTGWPCIDDRAGWIVARGMHWVNADEVWTWTPWLDEYVTAASFALCGPSGASARAPFAMAMLLAGIALSVLAWRLNRDHPLAMRVGLLMATSTPLVEHGRQCRYYALIVAAQVWLLWALFRAWRGQARWTAIHLGLALAVQFHANSFVPVANLCGLLLAGVCGGDRRRSILKVVALATGLMVLLAAPWVAYARPWQQGQNFALSRVGIHLVYYASAINLFVIPLVVPLGLGAVSLWRWVHQRRLSNTRSSTRPGASARQAAAHRTTSPAGEVAPAVIWLSIGYCVPLCCLRHDAFRYLLPLLPGLYFVFSMQLRYAVANTALRWMLVAVIVGTRWLADPAGWWPSTHFPVQMLAAEVARPQLDRIDETIAWLKPRVRPGDSLLVVDDELPLAFHLPVRLIPVQSVAADRPTALDELIAQSLSGAVVEVSVDLTAAHWPRWLLGQSVCRAYGGRVVLQLNPEQQAGYTRHNVWVHALRADPYEPVPIIPRGYASDPATWLPIYERPGP